MHLVEKVLGNIRDPEWKERLDGAEVDRLELSQWDAQKNRLRKETAGGLLLAVSLDRDAFLRDGDVLLWDEAARRAVLCRIDLCEVLVIDLSGLRDLPAGQIIERCVQLGHALGNQHWPAVVQDGFVYVPMAVNRLVMNSVMQTHHFTGISYSFAPGAEILDKLNPSQARRLFGGSERPMDGGHSHGHGHELLHGQGQAGHEHGHGHDHGHKHGHEHEHEHGVGESGHCHAHDPEEGGHSHYHIHGPEGEGHTHYHRHGEGGIGHCHDHRHERRACQDYGGPDHQHEEGGHECEHAGHARRNG